MNNFITRWFKKSESEFDEDEYINDILKNNIAISDTEINKTIEVIQYKVQDNTDMPAIIRICSFNGEVLPSIGSIIWAPNYQHTYLIPYRVERIDFLEDEEDYKPVSHKIFIVVIPATINMIL